MERRHGHQDERGNHNGLKRRRDDYRDEVPENRSDGLLAAAIRLCNKQIMPLVRPKQRYGRNKTLSDAIYSRLGDCMQEEENEDSLAKAGEQIDWLAKTVIRDQQYNGPKIIRTLLDCVVELSHKTPAYAALIGLLNTEEEGFVGTLLSTAQKELNAAFASGDRNSARLLLRFFAALVPSNVLYASSVLKTFKAIVETASEIAEQGGNSKGEARLWQPYADYLVYSVLVALPWGGSELMEASIADSSSFLEAAEKYMDARPIKLTTSLRPFFEGQDTASTSDSGAASFLGQLWEAVEEMQDSNNWKVESVPEYVSVLSEAKLATSTPHNIEAPIVPLKPPCLQDDDSPKLLEASAKVLLAYPPRGVIRLLPSENTWGDKPKIERLVAEEYMLDTMHYFDGDRIKCARTLALGLPLKGKLESIITELIFSQMLRIPTPHFRPIAYATVLADVCKLLPTIPRSMSACVRELFQRMGTLDPQLRTVLAEWLAYHLSNFDFMWPWAKWTYVLQAPAHDAQRRFVVDVFSKLIRLSYYGNILSKVPDTYKEIFPPKPEPLSLDEEVKKDDDEEMADGVPSGPANPVRNLTPLEKKWAAEFVAKVKQKRNSEECLQWIENSEIEKELGSKVGVLRAIVVGLLTAGSKSFTHMLIALERYDNLLNSLVEATGHEGRQSVVDAAASLWQNAPQRAAQVIDRLMAHRVVDGPAVLHWAFSWPGFLTLTDQLQNGLAWEVLHNAVNKTLARTQDATEDLQEIQAKETARRKAAPQAPIDQDAMLGVEDDHDIAGKEAIRQAENDLAEALKDERDLFTLCVRKFNEVLTQEPQVDSETDQEAQVEAQAAWRKEMLAQLRSFVRRFYTSFAPFAEEIQSTVFDRSVSGDKDREVKDAYLQSLAL